MDSAVLIALITATASVLVALIGAGWLRRRRAPAEDPDVELLRRIEVEEATSELLREQRDAALGDVEEERQARAAVIATLATERDAHDRTKERLDDCARQKSNVESDLRALERELAGVKRRGKPRPE